MRQTELVRSVSKRLWQNGESLKHISRASKRFRGTWYFSNGRNFEWSSPSQASWWSRRANEPVVLQIPLERTQIQYSNQPWLPDAWVYVSRTRWFHPRLPTHYLGARQNLIPVCIPVLNIRVWGHVNSTLISAPEERWSRKRRGAPPIQLAISHGLPPFGPTTHPKEWAVFSKTDLSD